MAAYTLESDKLFVGSYDMDDGIQVYELDGLYKLPVKSGHWKHLDLDIKSGNKFEALKIGQVEILGVDLKTLTQHLFNTGLMVNREGLCFLPTRPHTALEMGLEYFRMFDLYDWSQYGVQTSLKTRWAPRDIVQGRPLDIVGDSSADDAAYKIEFSAKEKEWEEEKQNFQVKIEELEYEMEVALRKKDMEIEKLKENHGE